MEDLLTFLPLLGPAFHGTFDRQFGGGARRVLPALLCSTAPGGGELVRCRPLHGLQVRGFGLSSSLLRMPNPLLARVAKGAVWPQDSDL